jgi:hypothetical protein
MPLIRKDSPFDKIQYDIDCNSVVPIDSPVIFTYESNTVGVGSRATATITILPANAANIVDGYTINFNGQIIVFSSNPTVFQAQGNPASSQEILESLAYVLSTNPALSYKYSFFVNGNSIEIRALFDSSLLNISLSQTVDLPAIANGFSFATTQAVNANFAQSKLNYGVEIEIWKDESNKQNFLNLNGTPYTSSNFVRVTQLAKSFAKENLFEFDVSTALRPFVRTKPPKYFKFPKWEKAMEMAARYAVVVFETWVENGIKKRIQRERLGFNLDTDELPNALWFVKSGGFTPYDFNQNYEEYYQFWRRKRIAPDLYQPIKCLTHQPNQKRTHLQAREYLYFVFDKTITYDLFQLRVDFTFEDCTTLSSEIGLPENNNLGGQEGGIYYIEVSPQIFDINTIENNNGSKIASYKVYLQELSLLDNQFINQEQTYILDNDSRCFQNDGLCVVFANQLGGFDTLTPLGNVTKLFDVNKLSHEKTLQFKQLPDKVGGTYLDYSKVATVVDYDSENIVGYEINSGWVDKIHYDWLMEFVKSVEIYIILFDDVDLRAEPRRCRLTASKWEKNSLEDSYNLNFTLTLGYE